MNYLNKNERFLFPKNFDDKNDGLLGAGLNLSPGYLLSAYEQGIFPWFYHQNSPYWFSPPLREIIEKEIHISKSLRKSIKKLKPKIKFDSNFLYVIKKCSYNKIRGPSGWIDKHFVKAYLKMHELGFCHSLEVYVDGKIEGGLYGICLGSAFFGESMFAQKTDCSKISFVALYKILIEFMKCDFIDCQVPNQHLKTFNTQSIPRSIYIEKLNLALQKDNDYQQKKWSYLNSKIQEILDF